VRAARSRIAVRPARVEDLDWYCAEDPSVGREGGEVFFKKRLKPEA
jgi:hypothetical protein